MSSHEVVGIDIASRTLSPIGESVRLTASYENTPAGRDRLIATLRRSRRPVRVVLEATGIYFLDLACALAAAGIAVMVVNPKAAHHFAEAILQRRKDDPVDAAMLREYGRRMPFRPWTPPAPELVGLRETARQVQAFTKQAAADKNRLHALRATALAAAAVIAALERQIAHTEALIEELLAAARRTIAADPELARRLELADSLPGVGAKSAVILLAELAVLPPEMTARQWVALAGLDVREERSGTSVGRKPHISRRGNKRLREALFYPALAAARSCAAARAFAERLRGRGKTPLQAVVAVMRKLIHGLHALWRTNTPFAPDKLFPNPA